MLFRSHNRAWKDTAPSLCYFSHTSKLQGSFSRQVGVPNHRHSQTPAIRQNRMNTKVIVSSPVMICTPAEVIEQAVNVKAEGTHPHTHTSMRTHIYKHTHVKVIVQIGAISILGSKVMCLL